MTRLSGFMLLLKTLYKLGVQNLIRVGLYKAKLHLNLIPQKNSPSPEGAFFDSSNVADIGDVPVNLFLFGVNPICLDGPPDWHTSYLPPFSSAPEGIIWRDALNALDGLDPKFVWELSRFGWAPQWALAALDTGDLRSVNRLNTWLDDWIRNNPPYFGVNWACGQESAIRVMHLVITAMILDEIKKPSEVFQWYLQISGERIYPTIGYAIGQDNNHGSAEACALYIIGLLGIHLGWRNSRKYYNKGRKLLEDRVRKLILADGSSCQYSINYHRANLETFCIAELVRRNFDDTVFSRSYTEKMVFGAKWIFHLADPHTGSVPNVGANDGSHLNNVFNEDYRDFRSTVSLTARLFDRACAYSADIYCDKRASLFKLADHADTIWPMPGSRTFTAGGYHVLLAEGASLVFDYPNFNFRPSQADALNIDFNVGNIKLFSDAGSFSYIGADSELFASCRSHNTIEFDETEPMPKLSRFLFGQWLVCSEVLDVVVDESSQRAYAFYKTYFGAMHRRTVQLSTYRLEITDQIEGFSNKATLRWRLPDFKWSLSMKSGHVFIVSDDCPHIEIQVSSTVEFSGYKLLDGWESLYYSDRTKVVVAEFEVANPCTIITQVKWTQ
ncbi:heparinase II/III family protein [Rheinheimera faecalis]|uniref:heparinase II/III family protein n=1 Tax=Rheinheimera faecalis TaxID=2901141 RepID=UPI001E654C59|nr:heparinase II/III-family protein [Rheinheimera faecalis]